MKNLEISETRKIKVLVSFYNTTKIGGPNTAMSRLMNSQLMSGKYCFYPIIINEKLGKLFRVNVIKRLINEIKKCDPDIIYFTGLQLHGFYISLASFLAGYRKKTIMVVRGSSSDSLEINAISKLLLSTLIEPLTCRMTCCVHTVCKEMANNPIVRNNAKNLYGIIHNAAPKIENISSCANFRIKYNIPNNDILLVYTGRIVDDKGIVFLLSAMKFVKNNIKLALVGDGNIHRFQEISSGLGISDKVIFAGNHNDVLSVLRECDIFVFPSLHENLSNSLLEACACGMPIIATNVGGNKEIIRDNVDGILVKERDAYALADAINKLSMDKDRIRMFGEASKIRAETAFSQEQIYSQIDKMFTEFVLNEKYK